MNGIKMRLLFERISQLFDLSLFFLRERSRGLFYIFILAVVFSCWKAGVVSFNSLKYRIFLTFFAPLPKGDGSFYWRILRHDGGGEWDNFAPLVEIT